MEGRTWQTKAASSASIFFTRYEFNNMSASTRSLHEVSGAGLVSRPTAGLATPAILLALSGTSALIFQIIWIKQLSLIVGVEVHAIAVAISAFFLGLAAGGWWLGKRADRSDRPVRMYRWIEIGIAIAAIQRRIQTMFNGRTHE